MEWNLFTKNGKSYIVFGCVFTHPVCLCMRHEIDVGVCQFMNVFFGGRQNERKKEA